MAVQDQGLWLHFKLSNSAFGTNEERDRFHALEDVVSIALFESGVGEYDGNEIGSGEFSMFMLGSSADRMLAVALRALSDFPIPAGSFAIKRYGPPGSREETVQLV